MKVAKQSSKIRLKCITIECPKNRTYGSTFCTKCKSRNWRNNNQLKYTFNNLKRSAQKRNIPFHLTIQEWEQFVQKTDYINKRGRNPGDLSVDRIDQQRGYFSDNIRPLTVSENSSKFQKYKKFSEELKRSKIFLNEELKELPF